MKSWIIILKLYVFKDNNISKWPGVPLRKISGTLLSDSLEPEFGFLLVTLCSKMKLSALAKDILGAGKAGRGSGGGVRWRKAHERERGGLCQWCAFWGLRGLCGEVVRGQGTFSDPTVVFSPWDHFFSFLPLLPRGRTPRDLPFTYTTSTFFCTFLIVKEESMLVWRDRNWQHEGRKPEKCCCHWR